jgi:hypothetical protein
MAGGKVETDPEVLASHCERFMVGARRLYNGERLSEVKGDMWFFELFHHLDDCAAALRQRRGQRGAAKRKGVA